MLLRIVSILFPLFAIATLGYFVGRHMRPDLTHANKLNMDVFVPALVFSALTGREFNIVEFVPLTVAALAVVIGSGLAGWGLARALKVAPKTFVPPIMFNNCGNLGLPLAVLAFGEVALAPMVVLFMVSNLVHFSFGAWLLDRNIRLRNLWKVPSVLATVAGLSVGIAGVEIWGPAMIAVKMLGDISVPLMLFGLGVRLTDSNISSVGLGVFGATARPVVGMLLAFGVLQVIELPPLQQALIVVFGALPPAVLNYIFAERYRQEPETVASIVLIGNLAALLFLSIALALVLPD